MTRSWLEAGMLYPWKAAAMFAVTMAIAVSFIGEHPFPTFGPANRLTTIRLMMVALVAGLIGEPAVQPVAWVAALLASSVAALDGVDGWLARRSRMTSVFGARLDMETDALLIMVLSILVWHHEKAGAWVLLGGLMRYGFVAAGWLMRWMSAPLSPTQRAKVIAVAHTMGLCVAMAPVVPVPFSTFVAASTLAALSWSFSVDVRRLWRNS
jgi:phosphatidylglycerophosphate synthase